MKKILDAPPVWAILTDRLVPKSWDRDRYGSIGLPMKRAGIRDVDHLLFTTTTSCPVITQGRPTDAEIWVDPVK